MNNPFQIKPVRMILQGDKELAANYSGEAKRILFQLKNIQKTSPYTQELTKRYEDGIVINVHSKVKGMDVVNIIAGRGYGKENKEKYREYTVKYIAPVLLCYSWVENLSNRYRDHIAERMVIVRDLKTIEYVYEPTNQDKISNQSVATYLDADPEYEIFNFNYGSADNDFYVKSENYEKTVKIRELFDITASNSDNVYRTLDSTVTTTTGSTEGMSGFYNQVDSQLSMLKIFDSEESKTMGRVSYYEWHRDDPDSNTVIIDYDYLEKSGSMFMGASSICANPDITNEENKSYSNPSDAYLYNYWVQDKNSVLVGPLPPIYLLKDVLMLRSDTYYLGIHYNNLDLLKPIVSSDVYELPANNADSFGVGSHYFVFNNSGDPVFLFTFNPEYTYLDLPERYESGIRTDGMFHKVFYVFSYNGNLYETDTGSGYERFGDSGYTHLFKDSNGDTIKDKDGNEYYSSSVFRMVEVEETIREKVIE